MNSQQEEKLKELARELAKDIKTGTDLSSLSAKLVKLTVEAALAPNWKIIWVIRAMLWPAIIQATRATGQRPRF